MLTSDRLRQAQRAIVDLFCAQCEHGRQARDLAPGGATACGQFLDDPGNAQRGLHGTAAALRVLASSSEPTAQRLTRQLVVYLANRETFEAEAITGSARDQRLERVARDNRNVIKQSELLFAYSVISSAVPGSELVVTSAIATLQRGLLEGRGWAYWTNDATESPQPLPTASAVRALAAHRQDVREPVRYLMSVIEADTAVHADISVQVASLYTLAFLPDEETFVQRERLHKVLRRLWRRLEPLLNQDLESNIEYSSAGENFYVRVPWQLYLVAIAARLDIRLFAGALPQRRLEAIVGQVLDTHGFVYPHSGDHISARTNAIVYEDIGLVLNSWPQSAWLLQPYLWIDKARLLLGSRIVTYAGVGVALLLAAASIGAWLNSAQRSITELAPNLVAALLIFMLSGRKRA